MSLLEFSEDIRLFTEMLRRSLREPPVQTLQGAAATSASLFPGTSLPLIAGLLSPVPIAGIMMPSWRGNPPITPRPPQVGQVWTTLPGRLQGLPIMVLLLKQDGALWEGLLLTEQLWMATSKDLLLPEDAGTLGLAVVACLSRPLRIAPPSFGALLGEISPPHLEVASHLMKAMQGATIPQKPTGLVQREDLAGCENAEQSLPLWELRVPGAAPLRYVSGTEIEDDDDPREYLHDLLEQATRYLADETASWSPAPATAEDAPLWSRMFQGMKQAFLEAGASLLVPPNFVPARASQAPEKKPFQATLNLGDVAVDLDVRFEGEHLIFQGTAFRGDDPVPGVCVTLRRTAPGKEPVQEQRETNADGVIFAVRLLAIEEANYELEASFHGEIVKLRW